MPRPRPEEPLDPAADSAESATRNADRRKRRREEAEESAAEDRAAAEAAAAAAARSDDTETEPTPDPDPERRRREMVAEAAFRERVALRELADRLPPETYRAIARFLAGTSTEWRLEKGRYLFTYLVGERELTVDDRPVRIEHKLVIARDEPPTEPAALERRISEAVEPDAPVAVTVRNLEALRPELKLAPGDEVRIRPTPDQSEVVVTAAEVTVVEPAPGPERPADSDERGAAAGSEPETAGDVITPERVAAIVAAVEREAAPSPAGLPESAEPSAAPETVTDFGDVLAVLDREAVSLNDLPPMAGGAAEEPEPDRPGPEAPETEPPPPPEPPEPPPPEPPEPPPPIDRPEFPPGGPAEPRNRRHHRPHRRHPRREILNWEPGWTEVVRRPDHEMRKRGRKLIRRLAAEYGLTVTPDLEAYLLAILLQPHRRNGRLVYGIGLNVPHLISVLQVLKYNFNFTRRRPA